MNCPKCHAPIQQNEVFCGQCGAKATPTQTTVLRTATTGVDLLAATIPAFDKSRLSQRKKRVLVILVVCLLLISVFVCGKFTNFGETTTGTNTTYQSSIPTVGFTLPNSAPTVFPTVIPTLAPTPTSIPIPAIQPGDILCQSDWSSGLNGWIGDSTDWKPLNGTLLNDGASYGIQPLLAPCDLNSVPNYKVEATIQMQSEGSDSGFGLYVRYRPDSASGYVVGDTTAYGNCSSICALSIAPVSNFHAPITNVDFIPSTLVHTYTIDVKGNDIKVFIDGGFVTDVTDNQSLNGGSVGLWDKTTQLTVTSVKVTAL